MNDFKVLILKWYAQNKRNLPWRDNKNPYKIWLSEIILQQTRVEQGRSYFEKFTDKYPSVNELNQASEEEVLHLWQGLGYYSRARNLKFAAHQIVNEFNGSFPETKTELLQLKGVGNYTASAIASIAFNKAHAVVDGNVYRVISRLFEDPTPIDTNKGQKHFQSIADELLDINNPGEYNQAIMELGALVCTPKKPHCQTCPVLEICQSGRNQTWDQFPVKSKKVKVSKRSLHYIVYLHKDKTIIRKRTAKDIWKGLYDFPVYENQSLQPINYKQIPIEIEDKRSLNLIDKKEHKLTHQKLSIFIYTAELEKIPSDLNNYNIVKRSEIKQFAFPIILKNFISESELF